MPTREDPTAALIEIVSEAQDRLGLEADAGIGSLDVTRWELFAAPAVVELDAAVASALAEAWRR